MEPTTGKQNLKPDAELRRVLSMWDDKDADALIASKARLDALGLDAYEQLSAFLRRRTRLCRHALWFAGLNSILFLAIMVGWSAQHNAREPFPFLLACVLTMLFAAAFISFVSALAAVDGKLSLQATKAIAEQTAGRYVSVLAELRCAAGAFNNSAMSSVGGAALLKAIDTLLTAGIPSDFQFSVSQLRCLRSMIHSPYSDLTCAGLRLLTRLEDREALPFVRRMAAKSRIWEVREAAQDYLAHVAPDNAGEANRPDALLAAFLFSAATQELDANNIQACVMALGSRSEAEHHAAEILIRRMEPEQIRQVLLLLDQEPDVQQRRKDRITIVLAMLAAMLVNSVWFPLLLRVPYFDNPLALKVMFGLMMVGLPIGWLVGMDIVRWRRNGRRARQLGFRRAGVFPERRLLDTLQKLDNISLVGTLVDALPGVTAEMSSLTNLETNRAMRTALTHLLPRLQASDANLLNTAQRARLNHELARSKQTLNPTWAGAKMTDVQAAFHVAILKAWEQIGDEQALPVVQKLAAQTARTPAQKRVQEAAQSCLPYLEARAGEQRAVQTLLRATETPTASGHVLLRAAASGNNQPDAAQLLRANAGEE